MELSAALECADLSALLFTGGVTKSLPKRRGALQGGAQFQLLLLFFRDRFNYALSLRPPLEDPGHRFVNTL